MEEVGARGLQISIVPVVYDQRATLPAARLLSGLAEAAKTLLYIWDGVQLVDVRCVCRP